MKAILLLLALSAAFSLSGCNSAPLPDQSQVKRKMPPGWKPTGDVLLPIHKG